MNQHDYFITFINGLKQFFMSKKEYYDFLNNEELAFNQLFDIQCIDPIYGNEENSFFTDENGSIYIF